MSGKVTSIPLGKERRNTNYQKPEFKLVIAHHPYEAQREDEISFEQDEIIKVTDFSDPDWWVGKKKDGSLGFFPSNVKYMYKKTTILC